MDTLQVQHLSVSFHTENGLIEAISDLSFTIPAGKSLALVGESGCGKSLTALSIMGLLPENGRITSGVILYNGQNLLAPGQKHIEHLRGKKISMIFQEPMTALNPLYTIGQQISEMFFLHEHASKKDAYQKTIDILKKVNIPDPHIRIDEYPFQMSGGMRQRVLIAMALACKPELLIADEPTTALDVTIQSQILRLIKQMQIENHTSMIFVTHDLGVVAQVADYVAIMYAGNIVEYGTTVDLFRKPFHPYTQGLIASIPNVHSSKHKPLYTIPGHVPSLKDFQNIPCRFSSRCSRSQTQCLKDTPLLQPMDHHDSTHLVACHYPNLPLLDTL